MITTHFAQSPFEPSEAFLARVQTTPLRELCPHRWYPGFMPGLPDLLLLKLPPELQHPAEGLPLTLEHKICIVEDDGNRRVVEDSLDKPLPAQGRVVDWRKSLDRVMARRSSRPKGNPGVVLYAPPEADWPWLVLTFLHMNVPGADMARDRYAWEAFATEQDAHDHVAELRAAMPPGMTQIVTPNKRKFS